MRFRTYSHSGPKEVDEILFSTQFDYFFPAAARSAACLLVEDKDTVTGLKALADLMGDPRNEGESIQETLDSPIPAIFTYLGQFIDHDITARTDRESKLTTIGGAEVTPVNPDDVVKILRNGRRPELDLDSVFGDGPGLVRGHHPSETVSNDLYDDDFKLNVFERGRRIDVPRHEHTAIIADGRNDENIMISQIQARFLKLYNDVYAKQRGSLEARYVRARQLVRWAYQYLVVEEYLKAVCDPGIVLDTLANGPRFIGYSAGRGAAFMPLEFSVAGFRFGHSMIRPSYELNKFSGVVDVMKLLGTSGNPDNFDSQGQLVAERMVDFERFVGRGPKVQFARRIDTQIARGLFALPFEDRRNNEVLKHLARSNLLRGYNLSIPTGQAMADGFGVKPLTPEEMVLREHPDIVRVLEAHKFHKRTPLWYYVLREAAVQQRGKRLGELGSRLVCETIIGLLKQDPNSYLNNQHDPAVRPLGIDVDPRGGNVGHIKELSDVFL